MSRATPPSSQPNLMPETQGERWLKYGGNVILSALVLIAIAVLVIYVAETRADKRLDTTALGENSLSPQTRHVLDTLDKPIKIVSLYTKPPKAEVGSEQPMNRAQRVSDLLDEYRRYSSDVIVESLDPVADPGKVDDLVNDLETRYGSEIKNYRALLDAYRRDQGDFAQLHALLSTEAAAAHKLSTDNLPNTDLGRTLATDIDSIGEMPSNLEREKQSIDQSLAARHPDYSALTQSLSKQMADLSHNAGILATDFPSVSKTPGIPQEMAQYMLASAPRWKQIGAMADAITDRINKLGELKVNELLQALSNPNPILVLGPSDWRILSEGQVWRENTAARSMTDTTPPRPVFAGEQMITSAIYSLSQGSKPLVVFVRPGGEPLTTEGFPPFVPGGPFSEIADRLKEYNFDVMEKDVSGQYAMQAQMQGRPAEPEATDEQLSKAIWVVMDLPNQQQQNPMAGPPPSIAPRLAEHLEHGGSALIMAAITGEDLSPAVNQMGIDIHNNIVAVHDPIPPSEGQSDILDEIERVPFAFVLKDYGPAALAKPLANLDVVMGPVTVVETHSQPGVDVQPLLPIPTAPQAPRSWGDADLQSLENNNPPVFSADKGDLPAPIYAGAVSEKGSSRVVVLGSFGFMSNHDLDWPDPKNQDVALFPGNGELAMNSLFWLAHLDSMISISPSSYETPRIAGLGDHALYAWRGFLVLIMPLGAMGAGLFVYARRHN
jgi:hypothetical protein